MIKISNLSKRYKTKDSSQIAINNLSVTLPSSGLVFITGKSGSGKSTLLNLIGGLDTVSNGEIIVDGNYINRLSDNDLTNYRSSYLGFVFQDYCLIQDLNIYNNVKVALDIIDDPDYSKIDVILQKLEMDKYKTRHPNELSGGQQQRVAIARAIIKDPKILLCDEPTGNLDVQNSKQVLEILKDLSKDRLVLVVSHNIDDAKAYADRIIEMNEGQIVSDLENDLSRNYLIENNTLYISNIEKIESSDLAKINDNISSIKEIKPFEHLSKTKEVIEEEKTVKFQKHSFKNTFKIGSSFLKHGLVFTLITSLLSGALVSIFEMANNFASFKPGEVIQDSLVNNNERVFIMRKGYKLPSNNTTKSNFINKIDADDDVAIHKAGLSNECFKLYNTSLPIYPDSNRLYRQSAISDSSNLEDIYIKETYGTLLATKEYFNKLFGNAPLLAGSFEVGPDYGVYIPDFVADSIMHYQTNYETYDSLIGPYCNQNNDYQIYGHISGIFKTDYLEKYEKLFKPYLDAKSEGEIGKVQSYIESPEYISLFDELTSIYGVAYTFNKNYTNAINNVEAKNFARIDRAVINTKILGKTVEVKVNNSLIHQASEAGYSLPNNYMILSRSAINRLLHTNYTSTEINMIAPLKINLKLYSAVALAKDEARNTDFNGEITIDVIKNSYLSGSTAKHSYGMIASDDLFEKLANKDVFPYAYYFTNVNNTAQAYEAIADIPFIPTSTYATAAAGVGNFVKVYMVAFVLLAIILCVLAYSLVAIFGYSSISKHKKDIGILKALGATNKDIFKIVGVNVGSFAVFVSIISVICSLSLTGLTNNILIEAFKKGLSNYSISIINIIEINPIGIIINIILVLLVSVLTILIPYLKLKKNNPINVIKGK